MFNLPLAHKAGQGNNNPLACFQIDEYLDDSSELHEVINSNVIQTVAGGGNRTGFDLHRKEIGTVDRLLSFIMSKVPEVAHRFTSERPYHPDNYTQYMEGGGEHSFNINGFKLAEVWGIVYNAGDGVIRHNHYPYALSFCYYANVPDDSAPFVLEGIQIPPKTGTVIFFLPHLYHWVPPTHSNGRSVITGNISYG